MGVPLSLVDEEAVADLTEVYPEDIDGMCVKFRDIVVGWMCRVQSVVNLPVLAKTIRTISLAS